MADSAQNVTPSSVQKFVTFGDPDHEAVNTRLHEMGWRFQSNDQFTAYYQKPGTNKSTILVYGNRRVVTVDGKKYYKCDIIAELPPEDTYLWTNLGWNEHHHQDTWFVYKCIAELICLALAVALYVCACAFIPGVTNHWYWLIGAAPISLVAAAILTIIGWFAKFCLDKLRSFVRVLSHIQLSVWRGKPRTYYRELFQTLTHADDSGRANAARLVLRFI